MQPILAGQHTGLHFQGNPEIRLLSAGFAYKATRRDTDDCQHSFAQGEGLAQHVGTSAEPVLPVVVANDGIGRLSAIVGRREYPPNCRAHAQNLKKSARYQAPACFLPLAALEADLPRVETALRSHQSRKTAGVVPQLFEFGIGQPAPGAVGAACPIGHSTSPLRRDWKASPVARVCEPPAAASAARRSTG